MCVGRGACVSSVLLAHHRHRQAGREMSSTEGRARHAQSTTPCTLGLRGGGEKGTRAARTQYERAQKLRACSERRRALAPEVSAPHPGLQPAPAILHHFLLPPLLRTGRGQGRSGESHSRPSPPAGSVPEAQKWLPLKLALFPTAPRPRPHSKQHGGVRKRGQARDVGLGLDIGATPHQTDLVQGD